MTTSRNVGPARFTLGNALAPWLLGGTLLGMTGCDGSKDATYAALDKHKDAYGRCGAMKESKEEVGGQPAWLAATACEAKFRQTVAADIKDFDRAKFEKHFETWKKEKGEAAIAAQRGKPITPDAAPPGAGMSEADRLKILNECNLQQCTQNRGTPEQMTCMEQCCRSKGMKVNCRE